MHRPTFQDLQRLTAAFACGVTLAFLVSLGFDGCGVGVAASPTAELGDGSATDSEFLVEPTVDTLVFDHPAFRWPAPRRAVTSTFYARRGRYRRHRGIDIPARLGDPLVAMASGKVLFAGTAQGYGKHVIIAHDGGYQSVYAHLSGLLVRTGYEVTRGQLIGRAGRTGNATGVHLHFEVHRQGVPVDPLPHMEPPSGTAVTVEERVVKPPQPLLVLDY